MNLSHTYSPSHNVHSVLYTKNPFKKWGPRGPYLSLDISGCVFRSLIVQIYRVFATC